MKTILLVLLLMCSAVTAGDPTKDIRCDIRDYHRYEYFLVGYRPGLYDEAKTWCLENDLEYGGDVHSGNLDVGFMKFKMTPKITYQKLFKIVSNPAVRLTVPHMIYTHYD